MFVCSCMCKCQAPTILSKTKVSERIFLFGLFKVKLPPLVASLIFVVPPATFSLLPLELSPFLPRSLTPHLQECQHFLCPPTASDLVTAIILSAQCQQFAGVV